MFTYPEIDPQVVLSEEVNSYEGCPLPIYQNFNQKNPPTNIALKFWIQTETVQWQGDMLYGKESQNFGVRETWEVIFIPPPLLAVWSWPSHLTLLYIVYDGSNGEDQK